MWHKPKKIIISVFSVIAHIFTLFFLVVCMLVILFYFLPDGAKNIERYVVFDRARDIEKLFLMSRLEKNEIKYEDLLKKMNGMIT